MTNGTENLRLICPERTWCEMENYPPAEHAEFHSSSVVNLAHYAIEHRSGEEYSRESGWYGWISEDREDAQVKLHLEGNVGGKRFQTTVSAARAYMLLTATVTPESRAALMELLEQIR